MRRLFYSAVMLSGSLLASAASAVTVWQGEAVITSASGCISPTSERRTISTGTVLKSVLRPEGVDNNGTATRISFIHDSGALFLMFLDSVQGGGDYAAQGVTHSGVLVPNPQIAGYASFTQTPVTVAADTVFVRLNGRVEDFMFIPGCDATFRASYSKR